IPDFEPSNDLERTLARCVLTGARATLLRALARSPVCFVAEPPVALGLSATDAGGVSVPCVVDTEGRHALVYTSHRQLSLAQRLAPDAEWIEVPTVELFARWPRDVDIWLNAGGELGFPLANADIEAVADIAAGLEVDEAYEIGPDDEFSDFPGPSVPDEVDSAIVLALFDRAEVLEIVRIFRRLEEPGGRTWRIVLIVLDRPVEQRSLAEAAVSAVNDASDECCEVHVADIHDDEVYDAVAHILRIGRPLWRREGLGVPDTIEGIDELMLDDGDDEDPRSDV
ncbi:MAG TPA: SseB family protein, partial [Mycobacteriales bacterium]|nr:SseB family protein [Mycobacteriales bacterium]